MDRKNYLAYGHNVHLKEIMDNSVMPPISDELEKKVVVSPSDAFLKLVYALDPVSKLPTGDLAYQMSDKANPEVKQWVLANIQVDTTSAQNLKAPDGLSDDDIIALTRSDKESVQAYAERVNVYLQNNKRLVEDAISRAKRDVSPQPEDTSVSTE